MAGVPAGKTKVFCIGSPSFHPTLAIQDRDTHDRAIQALRERDDLAGAVRIWFGIPGGPGADDDDGYVYHAIASVSLGQVQRFLEGEREKKRVFGWYDDCGNFPPPTPTDVSAYTSLFTGPSSPSSSLKSFSSNARKASLRPLIANHLVSHRFIHPSHHPTLLIPKPKKPPPLNPYLDFWTWSCHHLSWCGPLPLSPSPAPSPGTAPQKRSKQTIKSHPILPIFMHHFGCVAPSHEALAILTRLAGPRTILDVGSGSGYWTFTLRRYGATCIPVDNAQSEWRTTWVSDTVRADGAWWLSQTKNQGGRDMMLLMVYPIVGGGIAGGAEGGFTRDLIKAYKGDTIAVVGTQNHNGYTGFKDMTMDEFMTREYSDWVKVVQIPLPSFAAKDEALFVFQKAEKIPVTNGSHS